MKTSSSSDSSASGDGGGVCSYFSTLFGVGSGFDGGGIGDGDFEAACDCFNFFSGGCSEVGVVEGGERFAAAALEACVTGR